ncbi:MAG: hypothetical protein ACXW1S_11070, partial [Acidimicrobiia bacterium]
RNGGAQDLEQRHCTVSVCARPGNPPPVAAGVRAQAFGTHEVRMGLEITRATIADGMITYPPLADFPAVEDAGWAGIRAALRGELSTTDAIVALQGTAESTLAGAAG